MNVSSAWINSVNYWVRRLRMMDSGGYFQAQGAPLALIPQRFGLFELKQSLTPGATVTAYPVTSDGSAAWATDTSTTSKLQDWLGTARALGRDDTGTSAGAHGAYCIAIHDDQHGSATLADDLWLIVAIQNLAKLVRVTAPSGSDTAAGATFTGTSLHVMDDGQDPTNGSGSLAGITNRWCVLPRGATNVLCELDEPDGSGTPAAYRVVDAQRQCYWMATAPSANVAADATWTTSSGVTVLDEGADPTYGGSVTLTMTNWSLQLCSGNTAYCVRTGATTFRVIDAPCPPSGGCA
jgi:hypothetical protein